MPRSSRPLSSSDEGKAFLDSTPPSPISRTSASSGPDIEGLEEILVKRPYHRRRRYGIVSWVRARLRVVRRGLRKQSLLVVLKYLPVVFVAMLILTPLFATSYLHPPSHYHELKARCQGNSAEPGCANPFDEKVFISVSLYDKGGHLSGGQWGKAVLELIHLIGANNVFLSIYQNDSGPEGTAALEAFEKKVPCRHSIVNDVHVDLGGFQNVTMPDGTERTKRLAYLSEMRNRALRPLDMFSKGNKDHKGNSNSTTANNNNNNKSYVDTQFDKILFLNDVAFRPVDAAQLLFSTNVGADGRTRYLSTCALDYIHPLVFYDLYAQRDYEGYSNGLPIYPIFSTAGQGISRSDMLAQKDAVRVSTCWSGMVAMQARWVQNLNGTLPRPDFQRIGSHVIDPSRPRNVSSPVRFRHEPEVFFDACECCLFLADVSQVARGAEARDAETFVNPYVRVAYSWKVLSWLPLAQRWERLLALPHAVLSRLVGLPTHNPHRNVREGDGFMEEVWDNESKAWRLEQRVGRNGMLCGVREMQLVMQGERQGDVNWVNTKMPEGQTLNFPT